MEWTKQELVGKVTAAKAQVRGALQTVYDALNQGQQQKLMKNDAVKALFEKYGVVTE